MAQPVKDSFLDLEKHRQLLEDNIAKLRKSLSHWQTWDAEYDGLKEEILSARSLPNRPQLITLARSYEGDLVKGKEIEDILGSEAQNRSADQIVSLLDKRLDYVQQNVRTLEKQISQAEEKLARATVISTPDVRNEEGLPLTEIIEELDDEGNVISSQINTPGGSKPQLLEVLKKAGIKDISNGASPKSTLSAPENRRAEYTSATAVEKASLVSETAGNGVSKAPKPSSTASRHAKKEVKFTEETKPGPNLEKSKTTKRIEEIMNIAKQSEATAFEPPVIPTNESPEDAALRREMLQYGMSEVGAVVAELELEDGSDWSDGDYTDETDDEDRFGRSTGRAVNDEIRQQMVELEKKLGIRAMENVGKGAGDFEYVREGIGQITVTGKEEKKASKSILVTPDVAKQDRSQSSDSKKTPKKGVRFSEELDISPDPEPRTPSPKPEPLRIMPAPVSDIVERNAPTQVIVLPTKEKKQSRFKSGRLLEPQVLNGPLAKGSVPQNGPSLPLFPARTIKPFSAPIQFTPADERTRVVPSGPEGKTLAPEVIERDVPLNTVVVEPDELDPQLLHQELATEYHRMRNRMIQKQGGFMREEESEIVPLTEEEGGPKKVSRFKAARLARS